MRNTLNDIREKVVSLERGLYIVRYESANDTFSPPTLSIEVPACVTPVLHPDQQSKDLSKPGSALVLRVLDTCNISLVLRAQMAGGSLKATLKVERLCAQEDGNAAATALPAAALIDERRRGLRVIGHVARIGDIEVGPDEWIAGPSAPGPIEGLVILTDNRLVSLGIRYAAIADGEQQRPRRWVNAGAFVGTKGRAKPLVGIELECASATSDLILQVDAIFLGSPPVRQTGAKLVIHGPSFRERLVGLKFDLVPSQTATNRAHMSPITHAAPSAAAQAAVSDSVPTAPNPRPPATSPPSGRSQSGRVRVFRG